MSGGLCDLGEHIHKAAIREVYEETGMQCEYSDLLLIRETNKTKFGRPDIYFAFLLKCIKFEIKLDKQEVSELKWLPLKDIGSFMEKNQVFPTSDSILWLLSDLYKIGHKFYQDRVSEQILKKISVVKN